MSQPDYRLLVKRLRANKIKTDFGSFRLDICLKAAVAIERLLEERDAAIEDIARDCPTCKYRFESCLDQHCQECFTRTDIAKNWEWRGLQRVTKE